MSPDDKASLVEQLQTFCKTEVGMCGDGANDCGALKQADIGISLSEAEASIAAPFTSQIQDISSVVIVLREGRCALTTSFQMFKFIELYSMIQFINVTFLYAIGSNLSDYQFLYIDLFILVPLSMFMGQTAPYKHLTPHLPSGALISLPVLASVLGSVLIQAIFQVFAFFFISWWSFYQPPPTPDPDEPEKSYACYKNTSMFFITLFQYLVAAMAFSISKPFRQPIYTNLYFSNSLVVLMLFNLYITLVDQQWINNVFFIMEDVSMEFRLSILVIAFINSICTYLYEKIVIWYVSIYWRNRKDKIREARQHEEMEKQKALLEEIMTRKQSQNMAVRTQSKNFRPSDMLSENTNGQPGGRGMINFSERNQLISHELNQSAPVLDEEKGEFYQSR